MLLVSVPWCAAPLLREAPHALSPSALCSAVRDVVASALGDASSLSYSVQCGGRVLDETCDVPLAGCGGDSVLLRVSVVPRVCGGKGGFGANLRSGGGGLRKKNKDKSACRDLSGRRVRHADAEKAMRAWVATAGERVQAAAQKREEARAKKAEETRKREADLLQEVVEKSRIAVEATVNSLDVGLRAAAAATSTSSSSSSSGSGSSATASTTSAAATAAPAGSGAKRPAPATIASKWDPFAAGVDLDGSSSEDDDADSDSESDSDAAGSSSAGSVPHKAAAAPAKRVHAAGTAAKAAAASASL